MLERIDYDYDGMGRLWKATSDLSGSDDFEYLYDKNSNVTHEKVNGSTRSTFAYHPSNELDTRTTNGTTYDYSHDGNGNLTLEEDPSGADTLALTYNAKDQLTSAGDADTSAISMAYSGPGAFERTAKANTSYTNHLLGVGSETNGDVTTYYHRDPNGKLLSMQEIDRSTSTPTSTHYYYISDYMNSVLRVVESQQTSPGSKQSYDYEPYGRTTVSNTSITNPWRWAGGYHDEEVGLYKFGTRYYSPELLRFTQQDDMAPNLYKPIMLNRWAYAGDDPVNLVDPSGQFVALVLGFVGIATAVLGAAALTELGVNEVVSAAVAGCVGGIVATLAAPTPLSLALGCVSGAGANVAFQ